MHYPSWMEIGPQRHGSTSVSSIRLIGAICRMRQPPGRRSEGCQLPITGAERRCLSIRWEWGKSRGGQRVTVRGFMLGDQPGTIPPPAGYDFNRFCCRDANSVNACSMVAFSVML